MTIKNSLFRVMLIACLFASTVFIKTASGGDPIYTEAQAIEFGSAAYSHMPSPFKIRLAKKQGIPVEVKIEQSVPISGYLAKPAAGGPWPAIVLLHTCAGLSEHEEMWSQRLVSWGYVVLSVDSLTARGLEYICDHKTGHYVGPWARALDAYGAKQFLSIQPFVDPDRIAVMGMSHGGNTVLETIQQPISEGLGTKPFQAAIAFYPMCNEPKSIITPTLIMTGDQDLWTPAELCARDIGKLNSTVEIKLEVFTGAYHAFDHPGIDIEELGYIVRSNPEAAAEASQMTRAFLEKWL